MVFPINTNSLTTHIPLTPSVWEGSNEAAGSFSHAQLTGGGYSTTAVPSNSAVEEKACVENKEEVNPFLHSNYVIMTPEHYFMLQTKADQTDQMLVACQVLVAENKKLREEMQALRKEWQKKKKADSQQEESWTLAEARLKAQIQEMNDKTKAAEQQSKTSQLVLGLAFVAGVGVAAVAGPAVLPAAAVVAGGVVSMGKDMINTLITLGSAVKT